MSTWLIPTNRQKSHVRGNTMVLSKGVRPLLIISQYGRSSSGYQTLGLFYYPYVATEYGTREYTCQSVKYRTADAVECAGVTLNLERQPQPLKLTRYINYVGGNSGRKSGNFAVRVLLGCWADVSLDGLCEADVPTAYQTKVFPFKGNTICFSVQNRSSVP